MKNSLKKLLAILFAAIITLSTIATIGSFAAETADKKTGAATLAEEIAAEETVQTTTEEAQPSVPTAPTMAKVKNVKKTSNKTDSITLVWDKVPGVTGYAVYFWSVDYDKNYKKLGDFKSNTATAKKLIQGSPYTFKIAPYTIVDGKRFEGDPTVYKSCTQLEYVKSLTRARSSNVIALKWAKNNKAQAYRIYRTSPESGNKEVFVKSVVGRDNTTYTDKNVKYGNTYTYRVVPARTVAGTMYMTVGTGTKLPCRPGLGAPDFKVTSQFYRGFLTWNRSKYATRYDVYWSLNPTGKFTKLGSSTTGEFMTDKLPGGKKVYFRVFPVYKSGDTTILGTYYTKSVDVSGKVLGKSVGTNTYVEINIEKQHMWYYKNGKLLVSTDIVTGNKNSMDTPKGHHKVVSKARNTVLSGAGYSSFVSYWIGFLGSGYGIHDASWRSSFGGNIYKGNGSHGCVNTPYNNVKKIYDNISYGTKVIVY